MWFLLLLEQIKLNTHYNWDMLQRPVIQEENLSPDLITTFAIKLLNNCNTL